MEISKVTASSTQVDNIGGSKLGKNDFLNILAAQLKYQDPMEGSDNAQYIAQLAQFSSLEQMSNISEGIQEMKDSQNLLFAGMLIGKSVDVNDSDSVVSGIVESIKLSGSSMKVVIGGVSYDASSIVQIREV